MERAVDFLWARMREPRSYLIAGSLYGVWILFPLTTLHGWWWLTDGGFVWHARFILLWLLALAIAIVGGGLIPYMIAHLAKRFSSTTVVGDMVIFGLVWCALERLREPLVYGYTWGHLGFGAVVSPALTQHASWGGVYALSFLFAAALVGVVRSVLWGRPHALAWPLGALMLAWGSGLIILTTYQPPEPPAALMALHTGLDTQETMRYSGAEATLKQLEEALAYGAEVILLPENGFPMMELDTELMLRGKPTEGRVLGLFEELLALSRQHPDTTIVIGLHIYEADGTYNALLALRNGIFTSVYRKRVLMPFGEVVPGFLERHHTGVFQAGEREQTFVVGDGIPATPLLCSEVNYPRLASIPHSPLILNASNDSLFDNAGASRMNDIQARFRAVENRAWLVRAVKGGTSSIISPSGAVVTRSREPFEPEILMVPTGERFRVSDASAR